MSLFIWCRWNCGICDCSPDVTKFLYLKQAETDQCMHVKRSACIGMSLLVLNTEVFMSGEQSHCKECNNTKEDSRHCHQHEHCCWLKGISHS